MTPPNPALDETVKFIRRIAQNASSFYREMQDGIADALEATGAITPRQANAVVTGSRRQRIDIPPKVMDILRSNGSDLASPDVPSVPDDKQEFLRDISELKQLIDRIQAKWN